MKNNKHNCSPWFEINSSNPKITDVLYTIKAEYDESEPIVLHNFVSTDKGMVYMWQSPVE